MRLFTGVWPDERVASLVVEEKRALRGRLKGVKWVEDENMHFTIRFLGEAPAERAAAAAAAVERGARNVEPFPVEVGGTVLFPDAHRPRIIAVGLKEGERDMAKLFEAIEEELDSEGFGREARGFKAHMTLGRVRAPKETLKLPEGRDFGRMLVDEVRLVESVLTNSGPVYAPLARVKLGRGG